MKDTVRKVSYFSVDVPDRPGQTFRVLSTLVSAGLNLLACTGVSRGGRARVEVVPDDARTFRRAAKQAGLRFKPEKSGYLIQGKDRPGALAETLGKLAAAGINVGTVDGMTSGSGRWSAIIWVKPGDVLRAGRALRSAAQKAAR